MYFKCAINKQPKRCKSTGATKRMIIVLRALMTIEDQLHGPMAMLVVTVLQTCTVAVAVLLVLITVEKKIHYLGIPERTSKLTLLINDGLESCGNSLSTMADPCWHVVVVSF